MSNFFKTLFLLFTASIVISSCKKEDPAPTTEPDPTPTSTTASSAPQFTGSLDGSNVNQTDMYVSYNTSGNVGSGSGNPSTLIYGFSLLDDSFESVLFVQKGTLLLPNGFYPSNTEFDSFFPLGISNFDATLLNGVAITYTDSSGNLWSTAYGTANQTGSTFEVVDRVSTSYVGDHVMKVKIVTTCKLYNGSGGMIQLNNAVVIGRFANI